MSTPAATILRRARKPRWQFNETEIVELTWLNASENDFNLQAAVPGIESDQWVENIKENP